MIPKYNLDTTLITFSSDQNETCWSVRNAVEGVQIFGGIGSGKTSGSGKTIARKFLQSAFGGLVLTAKADEKDLWIKYCETANRKQDLIVIEPGGAQRFNFLQYISTHTHKDVPLTDNIVQVIKTVIEAGNDQSSGQTDDPFWENALDLLLSNVIDLCLLAYQKVDLAEMNTIAATVPRQKGKTPEEDKHGTFHHAFTTALNKIQKRIDAFMDTQNASDSKKFEDEYYRETYFTEHIKDYATLKRVDSFFSESFLNLSEKTRSIIEFTFIAFLSRLLKEPVHSLFCKGDSTVTPEDCLNGKIILLNIPVKVFQKVGRDVQIMFKYIWQLSMEKRDVLKNGRPVFLWADEAQNFLHAHDADYQATARSSRIATVYLSQNLPNYFANMGGSKSQYRVQSFLGTLATKIFHANADIETNDYASRMIGEAYTEDVSRSTTVAGNFSSTKSSGLKMERMVRPEHFNGLKTGGPKNNFAVDAYVHMQGIVFRTGFSYRKIRFKQDSSIFSNLNP